MDLRSGAVKSRQGDHLGIGRGEIVWHPAIQCRRASFIKFDLSLYDKGGQPITIEKPAVFIGLTPRETDPSDPVDTVQNGLEYRLSLRYENGIREIQTIYLRMIHADTEKLLTRDGTFKTADPALALMVHYSCCMICKERQHCHIVKRIPTHPVVHDDNRVVSFHVRPNVCTKDHQYRPMVVRRLQLAWATERQMGASIFCRSNELTFHGRGYVPGNLKNKLHSATSSNKEETNEGEEGLLAWLPIKPLDPLFTKLSKLLPRLPGDRPGPLAKHVALERAIDLCLYSRVKDPTLWNSPLLQPEQPAVESIDLTGQQPTPIKKVGPEPAPKLSNVNQLPRGQRLLSSSAGTSKQQPRKKRARKSAVTEPTGGPPAVKKPAKEKVNKPAANQPAAITAPPSQPQEEYQLATGQPSVSGPMTHQQSCGTTPQGYQTVGSQPGVGQPMSSQQWYNPQVQGYQTVTAQPAAYGPTQTQVHDQMQQACYPVATYPGTSGTIPQQPYNPTPYGHPPAEPQVQYVEPYPPQTYNPTYQDYQYQNPTTYSSYDFPYDDPMFQSSSALLPFTTHDQPEASGLDKSGTADLFKF